MKKHLPESIKVKLNVLSAKFGVRVSELEERYLKTFNCRFIQTDPQFKNEHDRHSYTIRVIWAILVYTPEEDCPENDLE